MAAKRKALSKRLRTRVMERDSWRCRYCGATPSGKMLHIDHVVPVSKGGGNDEANLVTSCRDCNLGKASRTIGEDKIPIDPNATKTLKARAKQLAEYRAHLQEFIDQDAATSRTIMDEVGRRVFGEGQTLTGSAAITVHRFVESIGFQIVCEMASVARAKELHDNERTWRYFCGCCRRRMDTLAAQRAEDEIPF